MKCNGIFTRLWNTWSVFTLNVQGVVFQNVFMHLTLSRLVQTKSTLDLGPWPSASSAAVFDHGIKKCLWKHRYPKLTLRQKANYLLLGLSKGNAWVQIPASFLFRSVANRSQVLITHALPFDSHACATFWLMSTRHGLMADEEKLSRSKISTETVYNTLKTHTKYAHIVCGRPTLQDVERFRNGSVHEPYERSRYERALISEPFIEKQALSHKLRPWEKPYQHTWKNFFKIFFIFN